MLAQGLYHRLFDQSCIHVVPFPVLVFLLGRWRRWRFLFDEIFPVEWTRGVQLQPRGYAFEIEHVVFVAGEADDERVFI